MLRWTHWHNEPLLIGGILLVVWLYAVLVGPLRRWIDPEVKFPKREAWWFGAAILSFYLAVGSPLDAAGENFLFSAHMLQHNILMYLTPLFTIWALPEWLVDGILDRSRTLRVLARFFVHPVVAGFLFTAVFNGWHAPALYELALRHKDVHTLEHLTMFVTSVLMCWPIIGRSVLLPRLHPGLQMLYLFLLMVVQIPLFAILTFAPDVFYTTYEYAPRLFAALDPLEDQRLGGLIMKVANMVFSLSFIAYAFILWQRESEDNLTPTRVRIATTTRHHIA
ncbi:MAG: cytochrome c oxidase assembly protein [Verrucomicrobiota bacterium JB022]|nr:cytochrome c oxidase assembly protein [Verrucomicrobiota bacterium JB022]